MKLVDQPALADPRDPDERDQLRGPLLARAPEGIRQEVELALPADERGAGLLHVDTEPRPRLHCHPGRDRLDLPFRLDGLSLAVVDLLRRRAVGRLVDQDAVHGRRVLQARCRVDDVPRDHPLALGRSGVERHERLAGRDRHAHLEPPLLDDRVADREARTDRTLRVVLVSSRRAEDGHHRVADELLHRAPVALELGAQLRVVRRERGAHVLGVELLGERRRPDEIGEEDADDLPLFAGPGCRRLERRAAAGAEVRALVVLVTAALADLHG